jgi:hypothetical protein
LNFAHDNSGPMFFSHCVILYVDLGFELIVDCRCNSTQRSTPSLLFCRMIWQHLNIGLDTLLNCRCNLQGRYWALFDKERICKKTRVC